MAGAIVFVVAMVVAVPVAVMVGGAVWTAAFGWLFDDGREPPSSPAGS